MASLSSSPVSSGKDCKVFECKTDELLFSENELNVCSSVMCSGISIFVSGRSMCIYNECGGGGIEDGGDSDGPARGTGRLMGPLWPN